MAESEAYAGPDDMSASVENSNRILTGWDRTGPSRAGSSGPCDSSERSHGKCLEIADLLDRSQEWVFLTSRPGNSAGSAGERREVLFSERHERAWRRARVARPACGTKAIAFVHRRDARLPPATRALMALAEQHLTALARGSR